MENKNLTPFPKGVSGNPKGRPKGAVSMTTRLKKILDKRIYNFNPIEKTEKKDKIVNHLIDILIAKALSGEDKAIIEIFNRIDGKVKEQLELSGSIDLYNDMSEKEILEELERLRRDIKGKKRDSGQKKRT